ncbi:MAG: glycosyltransferase family 87 protein [Candidatus Limnocylindrales bacterium]
MPPGGDPRTGAATRTATRSRLAALGERLFVEPTRVGGRRLPPLGLVVLAAIGASLLVIVASTRWGTPTDEAAYWRAAVRLVEGRPLYDPQADPGTPYAYFYPPPLAQVLAPLTLIMSESVFTAIWTVSLLLCLWWIAGRRPLVALACIAFVPVAVELWYRNVHLVLAVLILLAIRRWPALFAVGAAVKLAPGLGIVYLVVRRRWRDALLTSALGLAILVVSVAISPSAWADFISVVAVRGPTIGASLVPVPFVLRAIAGLALAVIAGLLRPRIGEPLLVVAIVIANPTLWMTVFSLLIVIVPLMTTGTGATAIGTKERPVLAGGRGVGSSG